MSADRQYVSQHNVPSMIMQALRAFRRTHQSIIQVLFYTFVYFVLYYYYFSVLFHFRNLLFTCSWIQVLDVNAIMILYLPSVAIWLCIDLYFAEVPPTVWQ